MCSFCAFLLSPGRIYKLGEAPSVSAESSQLNPPSRRAANPEVQHLSATIYTYFPERERERVVNVINGRPPVAYRGHRELIKIALRAVAPRDEIGSSYGLTVALRGLALRSLIDGFFRREWRSSLCDTWNHFLRLPRWRSSTAAMLLEKHTIYMKKMVKWDTLRLSIFLSKFEI